MNDIVQVNTGIIIDMLTGPAFTNFMTTYNLAVTIFLAVATITIIVLLFLNVSKLSTAGENASKRSEAMSGILICLVCLALAGGVDTVYAILLSIVFGFGGG